MSAPYEPEGNTLEPGTVVGEYEVTHKLGEGGMGVVYAGLHPEIGKQVAIKVLAPRAAAHPDLIRRFKEEARAVNKIRHPNIIDIFAFNQLPDGRHYFVMEYLEGESLTARLERGAVPLPELRRLLGQICSALEAAHQAGVVHRDLKPDNIWVTAQTLTESRIKLLDFGIAKLNDVPSATRTQAGVSMGTPHYMPPEQAMGKPIDARADIYALGVVLYQIFTGVLPFDGGTPTEIVIKHVSQQPEPPSRHRPIVPAGMEAIILACLQKDPSQRPASVKELAARIDAAFAVEPSIARAANLPVAMPGQTVHMSEAPRLATQVMPGSEPAGMTSLSGMAADLLADKRPLRSRRTFVIAAGIGAGAAAAIAALVLSGGSKPAPLATAPAASRAVVAVEPEAPPPPPHPEPAAPPAQPGLGPGAAAAPDPATVTINIGSEPSGARIVDADGTVIGRTPYKGVRRRSDAALAWKLELGGFKSRALAIPLRASFEGNFPLEKRSEAAESPRRKAAVDLDGPPPLETPAWLDGPRARSPHK